jgi:hypothetical protein
MSWLGDLLKFEGFNAKHMLGKIKDNPEQLLLGAADPFGAKLWGGILGKEYTPIVNQWGGASDDTYTAAQQAGIDTGPGRTGHNIAQAIAAMYAGNYGANQLGGLFGGGAQAGAQTSAPLGGQATSSTFIPGQDSAMSGYAGQAVAPSSVNLSNAGGTMSTGGFGNWSNYLRQAGDAAGAAQQFGLFGQQTPQAPAVSLQSRGDPVGDLLTQQAQIEALRRQRRGLLG